MFLANGELVLPVNFARSRFRSNQSGNITSYQLKDYRGKLQTLAGFGSTNPKIISLASQGRLTRSIALEEVRKRARAISADPSTNLPQWPNYKIKVLGVEKTPTLEEAIRHERRVELAMEGHRWYDLVRWGIAKETMDYYATTETPEAQKEMAPFIEGTHEYFPLPTKEVELMN